MYAFPNYADASLFSMFTFPFVQGNAETAFTQLYSMVVTQATAKKFFGDEKNVIGKTVRVDNKQDYVIYRCNKRYSEKLNQCNLNGLHLFKSGGMKINRGRKTGAITILILMSN